MTYKEAEKLGKELEGKSAVYIASMVLEIDFKGFERGMNEASEIYKVVKK